MHCPGCGETLKPEEDWISEQDECFQCYQRLRPYRIESEVSCKQCGFVFPGGDSELTDGICKVCEHGLVRYICAGRSCAKTVILPKDEEVNSVLCDDCHMNENYE